MIRQKLTALCGLFLKMIELGFALKNRDKAAAAKDLAAGCPKIGHHPAQRGVTGRALGGFGPMAVAIYPLKRLFHILFYGNGVKEFLKARQV